VRTRDYITAAVNFGMEWALVRVWYKIAQVKRSFYPLEWSIFNSI